MFVGLRWDGGWPLLHDSHNEYFAQWLSGLQCSDSLTSGKYSCEESMGNCRLNSYCTHEEEEEEVEFVSRVPSLGWCVLISMKPQRMFAGAQLLHEWQLGGGQLLYQSIYALFVKCLFVCWGHSYFINDTWGWAAMVMNYWPLESPSVVYGYFG